MRRLAALALAIAAAAAASIALPSSGARGDSTYRVDAIFDTAKGIIPGQLVKVAGARVGTVRDVTLTGDYKARIEMQVERRFAPFRTDASCAIQPEGLLSENFVQCDPGTPDAQQLRPQGDHPPTVAVRRTAIPVSINDLFNIWNVPTRERFTVLVNELGIGLAGRGQDLNEVLRRANPTLTLARRTIALLNRQRTQLQSIVTDSDRLVGELAARRDRVADFIDQAARVTTQTADHSTALAEGIRRLPALLAAARPALARLDEVAADGRPLLDQLRAAAPQVNRLTALLEPFAEAGLPALRGLGRAVRIGRRATRSSRPVIAHVRRFTAAARPLGSLFSSLFVNLRDRGFVENSLKFLYYGTAASARFDRISHILPAHLIANPCSQYSAQPVAGCSARYTDEVGPAAVSRTAPKGPAPGPARRGPSAAPATPSQPGPAPAAPAPPGPRPAPALEGLVDQVVESLTGPGQRGRTPLEDVAGYLLG
jgi:virulence factor Mce-like protein